MAAYVGEVMSSIAFRSKAPGANGIRTKQAFSRFGWCEVRHPYRVGSPEESDVFKAFGVEQKMTPSASKVATMFAVTHWQTMWQGDSPSLGDPNSPFI